MINSEMFNKDVFKKLIFSFILGDCYGVPFEFRTRHSFKIKEQDLGKKDFYFRFNKPVWSDDTSMILATFDSKPHDLKQLMENFLKFFKLSQYTTSETQVFDIGITIQEALMKYEKNKNIYECGATGEFSCGNGSLMRILPIFPLFKKTHNIKQRFELISKYSFVTHNHLRIFIANYFYLRLMELIFDLNLDNVKKDYIINQNEKFQEQKQELNHQKTKYINLIKIIYDELLMFSEELNSQEVTHSNFEDFNNIDNYFGLNNKQIIFENKSNHLFYFSKQIFLKELDYFKRLLILDKLSENEIKSSGYVVDTLEACFWCFIHSKDFKDSFVLAINLGNDTDTIAALTGSLSYLKFYSKLNKKTENKLEQDFNELLSIFSQNDINYINDLVDKWFFEIEKYESLNL